MIRFNGYWCDIKSNKKNYQSWKQMEQYGLMIADVNQITNNLNTYGNK